MPRPIITGTVIRRIDLHCDVGGSNKDYRITLTQEPDGNCRVWGEYGPAGRIHQGGEKTGRPVGRGKADLIINELLTEKARKGYCVLGDFRPNKGVAKPAPAPKKPRPVKEAKKKAVADPLSEESRRMLRGLI